MKTSKFHSLAGWLLIIGCVLIGIIAGALNWMLCVGWLAIVCFLFAYASHELAKEEDSQQGEERNTPEQRRSEPK